MTEEAHSTNYSQHYVHYVHYSHAVGYNYGMRPNEVELIYTSSKEEADNIYIQIVNQRALNPFIIELKNNDDNMNEDKSI